jgi:hypothetical protein
MPNVAIASASLASPRDTVAVVATSSIEPGRLLRTTAGLAIVNQSIWTYNRFFREGGGDPQFRVSWDSFVENVRRGFEWDGNNFWTNQFYHPAHGSLHFTVARAGGYNYWASSLWALAGSWLWENAGETNPPSTNDVVNSTLGGIALGEPLFRLSTLVVDNEARGGERVARELGGFLVAPGAELSRVLSGDAFRRQPNPAERIPSRGLYAFRSGYRSLADDGAGAATSENVYLEIDVDYGDPFDGSSNTPFRHFDFDLLYNVNDPYHMIGKIKVAGLIHGRGVGDDGNDMVGWFQHFDFFDNPAYEFGSQSVGAGYLARRPVLGALALDAAAHLKGILLSATRTDYRVSGRSYDFGMGLGYEVSLSLGLGARGFVTFARGESFVASIEGAGADHRVGLTTVSAGAPLLYFLAAGADYVRYDADRDYEDFADVTSRSDEIRAYVAWVIE